MKRRGSRFCGGSVKCSSCVLSYVSLLIVALAIVTAARADTVTWNVDADGDWGEGANWSTGLPPAAGDEVIIDRAVGDYTITVSTGNQFAGSILCAESLVISGGSLTVAATVQVDGEFRMTGGELIGATLTSDLTFQASAILDGVTAGADIYAGANANTSVTVYDGLTLNGTAYLGGSSSYGRFLLSGTQTLGGTGEVVFGASSNSQVNGTSGVLTIGPDLWIHGERGSVACAAGFVSQGRISADVSGGVVTLTGTGWSNTGIVEATGGGTLSLGGSFTTAGLGDFRGTAGRMEVTGTLDNTGDSLQLNAMTGSLYLDSGTIVGGTIPPATGGAELVLETGSTLDGVTYNADMNVGTTTTAIVSINNGLTLNGTATFGGPSSYGRFYLAGTQTLGGTGEVLFGQSSSNWVHAISGDLTIGPDLWIHGQQGRVGSNAGLVIQGRVSSDVSGGVVTVTGAGWSNTGIVEATGSGTLSLTGTFTTAGLGDFRGTDGRVEVNGTLDNTGDTLQLDAVTGSLHLDLGKIVGGTVAPPTGGAELVLETGCTLDGVTFDADMNVGTTTTATININNGLTLNGTATVGGPSSYGRLYFSGTQVFGGTGEVIFGASSSNQVNGTSGDLTVGPDVWIHGQQGKVSCNANLAIQGRISSDAGGGVITVTGTGWSNTGIIEATGGGTLNLTGSFTTAGMGDFRGTAGRVEINGTLDNTGDTLQLDATTGSLYLDLGRIVEGTIAPPTGGAELVLESGCTLDGVTLDADVNVGTTTSVTVNVNNGLTLNGTAYIGGSTSSGRLYLAGTQTFGGTGEVVFGANSGNQVNGTSGVLTIGPDLWIHGQNGQVRGNASFTIQGRVSADVPGGLIVIDGASYTNTGTIEAVGGALNSQAPATNEGTVRAGAASTLTCTDPYTQTAGWTIADSSGTLVAQHPLDIQGGSVAGEGTIEGDILNGGTVSPGASPGWLIGDGAYDQLAAGTFAVELGGTGAGMYDRLQMTGAAALAGTLQVDLVLDYIPAIGDSFFVMQYATHSGAFDETRFSPPPPGLAWRLDYEPQALLISVGGSALNATIKEINDVPDDEGGAVEVVWYASVLDDPGEPYPVTEYEVQRFEASWVALDTIPATYALEYATDVATDDIYTIGQPEPWSYYRILARTGDPGTFYNSPVDSGYSVDNLPPPAPVLRLTEDIGWRLLHWTNPDVPDFSETCLYRGTAPGYQTDSLLVCTPDTSFVDEHQFFYWYFAQAIDMHGNLSAWSNETQYEYPTDVPGMQQAPTVRAALFQNRPNPFNPTTDISFDLPREVRVELAVYAVDGRLVTRLIAGSLPAGSHRISWDGRDWKGRAVPSGVYFYRLDAGASKLTRRMSLVK